jgi:hypothetical protein
MGAGARCRALVAEKAVLVMQLRKSDEDRQTAREQRQHDKEQAAARQTELADERKQAAERERGRKQALRKERSARITATTALRWLGVAVRDGQVYKRDFAMATGREEGRLLGELAGAHAEVTGGRAGRRRSGGARTADAATAVLGPVGLLAGASRKGVQGTAFIVFADGTLHEKRITDDASLGTGAGRRGAFQCPEAEKEQPAVPPQNSGQHASSQPSSGQLTDELTRLASLHTSGALTDAEFQAAKGRLLGI